MIENLINKGGRSAVEKDPRFSLPWAVEQSVRKIATVNGIVDSKNFEKIFQTVKTGHDLTYLERMHELSYGQELNDLVEEWASYFPLYSLKEKTDIRKFKKRLSDPREIEKSKTVAEEIRKQLAENGISLKNKWDFGFKIRQDGIKGKMLAQTAVIKEIFDEYHLPNTIDGEAIFDFTYLPKVWKEGLLSKNFRTKIDDFKIDHNSLPELIEIYKRLESRKFRKQRKIVATNIEELRNITSKIEEPVKISEFENILTSFKK